MRAADLINQIFVAHTFSQIGPLLQDPILIHYNGESNINVDQIVAGIGTNHTFIISTPQNRPSPENPRVARSAILIGSTPEVLFRSLRGYRAWNARIQVVVPVSTESDVTRWLSTAWNLTRAVNVVIAVMKPDAEFYTWFPYKQPHCLKINSITKLRFPRLFPTKIKRNLEGCPISPVMSILPPLVFDESHGLEPRIVQTGAQWLNLTLDYYKLPSGEKVWVVVANDTPVFGLRALWDNKADIMFSNSLIAYSTSRWAEFVTSHVEDTWKWFVPGPRPLSQAVAIFKAFSGDLWTLVASVYLVILTVCIGLHLFETGSVKDSMIRAYCLNLYLPTSFLPSKAFKVLAMAVYIYSLHTTTAYQSSLISFLSTVPREPALKNVEDVAASKFRVEFHQGFKQYLASMEQPYMKELQKPTRVNFAWQMFMSKVAQDEDAYASLAPGISYVYQVIANEDGLFFDQYGYPKIITLKEPQFIWPLTMYFSPGHPLVPIWDQVVQRMVEGGFSQYFLMLDGKQKTRITNDNELRPFGVANVEGAFYLLHGLEMLAVFVFVAEVLSGKRKYRNK